MSIEQQVASHYGRVGLEHAILEALRKAGKDPDHLVPSDLSGADEFHLGWRPATVELASDLRLTAGMRLLDLGAGIGGPARHFADQHGCIVTGVDLTEDYVAVASALTRRCGLADQVTFRQASALELPFENAAFERVTLIHVGMNIGDKTRLFAEARRVLERGGLFGVYDIMRTADEALTYPMPWAETAGTSFVEPPETYRALFADAGFTIERETDRREMCLALARRMREDAEANGPPPLGLHVLMGPATPRRLGNVMAALQAGHIAPVEMIARAQ